MNYRKRFFTALVLLSMVFVGIQYFPPLAYFLFIQIFILAALFEFYQLPTKNGIHPYKVLGIAIALLISASYYVESLSLAVALFVSLAVGIVVYVVTVNNAEKVVNFPASIALTYFGPLYLSFTMNYLYYLREEKGSVYIYFIMAVIFVGDTGAFIVGKKWGKHKLAPLASPNKTWEGAICGSVSAALTGLIAQPILLPHVPIGKAVLIAFLAHLIAQFSDPLESLFKRAVKVKDSSGLLPGHGGFLDRLDSLIMAVPGFYYLLLLLGL